MPITMIARLVPPLSVIVLATSLVLAAGAASLACGDDDASPGSSSQAKDAGGPAPLCKDGKPTVAYPPPPYELGVLGTVPEGLSFDGPDGPVRIDDFFEPCSPRSRILVVRSSAAWCGPCQWHAAHTRRMIEDVRLAGRVMLLDLLVADEDNLPATATALGKWREKIDAPGKLAIDPNYTFGPALLSRAPLPEYVLVDTRTMKILATKADPDPVSLVARLELELADLDMAPRPPAVAPPLVDDLFTENEMDLIRGMKLGGAPPPDPTNEYGDEPAAVALGKALFADRLLSPSKTVSCETCHDPGLALGDGVDQSTGVAKVDRNSPSVALSAHSRWQFWDGRADTLWMQALGPFEDAKEFGSSRLYVVRQIAQRYATQYDAVFGAKYLLPADVGALPEHGKPGDAAYDALSAADKDKATRIFVNVGKAIAAFERAMRVKPNALDEYVDGKLDALSKEQKHALTLFMRNGCVQCHWGPRLTDDAFHALRFPTGRQDGQADTGREGGLLRLAASEFRASSKWSDAPSAAKLFELDAPTMLGAFKTPTLRGLPSSAPYGHGGKLKTLLDVAHHYGERGLEHGDPAAVGTTEQWVPNFDTNAQAELPPLLEVLTGDVVLP